ncbi:DUF4865 family protein [Dactylosporangium sp. NPDC049742]
MQYELTLPADHDMRIIRTRVRLAGERYEVLHLSAPEPAAAR